LSEAERLSPGLPRFTGACVCGGRGAPPKGIDDRFRFSTAVQEVDRRRYRFASVYDYPTAIALQGVPGGLGGEVIVAVCQGSRCPRITPAARRLAAIRTVEVVAIPPDRPWRQGARGVNERGSAAIFKKRLNVAIPSSLVGFR
jgi:hypothetical protein